MDRVKVSILERTVHRRFRVVNHVINLKRPKPQGAWSLAITSQFKIIL